ncbi:glycine C-acetyltransferase [Dictyocaulus viviparus]|uniref:Glycine C-acetyltransferase n=1 Tax=Dictyocaulus viviparus TaxID=29172 RepID=A0A0D8XKA9_DICVI|nr:glycine C-acetyltransferase [Dictyocaulus viviparus]
MFSRTSIRFYSKANLNLRTILNNELDTIKVAGTYKNERIITGPQGVLVNVMGQTKPVLNFCANNYLGLSSHPEVIKAGQDALVNHGAGLSSVRFICGTQDIHKQLEEKIAKFHGMEDSILYAACFDANGGLFEVLTDPNDVIISDELNHASIIDGIRLCKAKKLRFKHMDLMDLEEKLKDNQECRQRVIVTDGVFSMDGDVAPLKEICDLADKYNAVVFVDECHASGFFGPTGRGTEEAYNAVVFVDECHASGFFGPTGRGTEEALGISGRVDIINSTLGKALGGSMGGYTTGPKPLIDLLRQRSRPYLFSNSLAPSIVGSSIKVFDLLMSDSSFIGSLKANVLRFRNSENFSGKIDYRSNMKKNGFIVLGNDNTHPICPVLLGDARLASEMADALLMKGIYVVGFSYPVVPTGKARIRVQISAAHTTEHIDVAVDAFTEIGKKLGVI